MLSVSMHENDEHTEPELELVPKLEQSLFTVKSTVIIDSTFTLYLKKHK